MSYEFYKILHFFGIMLLLTALGGLIAQAWLGQGQSSSPRSPKLFAIVHGIALLVIFVAGFGLMAKKGLVTGMWPLWIFGKLGVWLLLGAALAMIRRMPQLAKVWFFVVPILGATAAVLALYQPG